jgi:hypothetical protein
MKELDLLKDWTKSNASFEQLSEMGYLQNDSKVIFHN